MPACKDLSTNFTMVPQMAMGKSLAFQAISHSEFLETVVVSTVLWFEDYMTSCV